jgi:glycosyltransferase involved in cell wall biosynthesis
MGGRRSEDRVYRWLEADLGWENRPRLLYAMRLARKEIMNRRAFSRIVHEFRPDVVYLWNLNHLSIALAFDAQDFGLPCCYFVSDNWLSKWEADAWFFLWRGRFRSLPRRVGQAMGRAALSLVGMIPSGELKLQNVHFASLYLKQVATAAGKDVSDAKVIHWGIDVGRFPYRPLPKEPRRILYAGQVMRHKGVGTAIEAMNIVVNANRRRDVELTIVGGSLVPSYVTGLRRLTATYGLQQHVDFAGPVPREQMPSVYQEHDILVFPSTWDEPFSIGLLEAFSSGLAVVGTATGGSAEILQDGFNALVFPREDGHACAERILRLLDNTELFESIRQNARHTVETNFCLQRQIDAIEESLQRIAADKHQGPDVVGPWRPRLGELHRSPGCT